MAPLQLLYVKKVCNQQNKQTKKIRKPDLVAYTCSPSIWETETGELLDSRSLRLARATWSEWVSQSHNQTNFRKRLVVHEMQKPWVSFALSAMGERANRSGAAARHCQCPTDVSTRDHLPHHPECLLSTPEQGFGTFTEKLSVFLMKPHVGPRQTQQMQAELSPPAA